MSKKHWNTLIFDMSFDDDQESGSRILTTLLLIA